MESIGELTVKKYRNGVKEVPRMYCPHCATLNAAEVKFCRSCGIELEAVAFVLSGKSVPTNEISTNKGRPLIAQDWLENRCTAVRNITTGASLLAVSLLMGAALAIFLPNGAFEEVPWILVWIVFFGWMACWGSIKMGNGISGMLESRSRLHLTGASDKELASDSTPQQLLPVVEPAVNTNRSLKTFRPLSVTEGTTRQLDDCVEK
jgi:hypothetical protein